MKLFSLALIAFLAAVAAYTTLSAAPSETLAPWTSDKTHFTVGGPFLIWFKSHCDVDLLGHPTSGLEWHPTTWRLTQNFERGALELVDGRPVMKRSVDEQLSQHAPAISAAGPNTADYIYFAIESGGTGHAVRNHVKQANKVINIGFKTFFERCGGVEVLGYPKEEPKLHNGRWTQLFQSAMLQYFPEHDSNVVDARSGLPMRNWAVQPIHLREFEKWMRQQR